MVDTSLPEECIDALDTLVRDDSLRQSLEACGLRDIGQFFPERAAYRILEYPLPLSRRGTMIKIDVLYEHIQYKPHGCGHIRLLGPLGHPQ